jgi:hypothetical protein
MVAPAPKVLFMDEEISKTIYATYPSNKPQYLKHTDIIQDWFMICAAWRWRGAKKVNSVSLLDDSKRYKKNKFDDYHVVKTLRDVVAETDVLVGHNMANFDWKKLLERVIYHGMEPMPMPKIVDTLAMSRRVGFSYKNLDYLTKRLDISRKKDHSGNDMWMAIVQGQGEEPIKECVRYCKGDVPACEELFEKMLPYIGTSIGVNCNLVRGKGIMCCPKCSSLEYQKRGYIYTNVTQKQRYQCYDCKSWFTDGKTIRKAVMR